MLANVTLFNDPVLDYIAGSRHHMFLLTETHTSSQQLEGTRGKIQGIGRRPFLAHAEANWKSRAGREATANGEDPGKATSGGTAIIGDRWLELIEPSTWTMSAETAAKIQDTTVILWRTQGLTIAIAALYLEPWAIAWSKNMDKLGGLGELLKSLAMPFIIGGDFNCEPEELIKTGWPENFRPK